MTPHPAYELFEELGRGTNTVVYRSYDLSLGREVAIKELDENARRDPRHRERFLREAQFLAQFEHDNVLRVYSVDPDRGWIIMERMKGTLASKIAAGPSDPDLVRSVLKQTLDALAFLHEKQKVHGTVRPTNLLINDTGRVKLSEFEQTAVGGELRVPTGSKKYLAPELIRPEFGDFGPPLDLYCLGFTALELLKGPQFESLFPGTGKGAIDADIAWLRWHSSPEELPSTKKLVKGIPDDLAHVLDRMLRKRVEDRAQTAQEVLRELADRPFIPVSVTSDSEIDGAMAPSEQPLMPGVVRTLAPGQQTTLPPNANSLPSVPTGSLSSVSAGTDRTAKQSGKTGKPAPAKFSKEWLNQELERPYVLYPLCALILLGALWLTVRINSGGAGREVAAIPVTFDVEPDSTNVEILEDNKAIIPSEAGIYAFSPGRHSLTFRKEGFHPVTQEIDVSTETNKFAVKLEPIIRWQTLEVQVAPADAELKLDGASQALSQGAVTYKHQSSRPLEIVVYRDGYLPITRSFTPEELAELKNKISIALEREPPRLPESLVEKPGAPIDAVLNLPLRTLATRLSDEHAMEFALVKPGKYSYGVPSDQLREGELPKRSVEISQPLYIGLHEVTNAQYQHFASSMGGNKAGTRWVDASKKWAEPLKLDPLKNSLPATNVSAEQAVAFCEWLGGRLPTEIEWESAVRGAADRGFPFPWGRGEPTRDRCQIFYGELGPVPVESLAAGASPLGLMHTLGNAAEWCLDSDQSGAYILRGCSFATANIDDVRTTWRRRGDVRGEEDTGFRVVVSVPIATPAARPISSQAAPASSPHESGIAPNVLAPVVVLFSLPWKSYAEELGIFP